MDLLVTGGGGYIGSHTCLELLRVGHRIVIVDNFATSTVHNYKVLQEKYPTALQLESGNLCDEEFVERVFQQHQSIKTVIHFAAYKSVGESVRDPVKYYENNIGCTLSLLKTMKRHHVHNLIFSSSAAVYGEPTYLPIDEAHPCNPQSPYGKTKYFIEEILKDVASSDSAFQCVLLRYFNPVGTDPSGILRENTRGVPENLMPYMVRVVHNNIRDDDNFSHLNVYGTDYDTKDGTGVRDYIHVSDLALGHLSALNVFETEDDENIHTYNLGTGTGYSVWEMVQAMNKASGKRIIMHFEKRRPGDVAVCYADATKAYEEMGWKATYDLEMMCKTSL